MLRNKKYLQIHSIKPVRIGERLWLALKVLIVVISGFAFSLATFTQMAAAAPSPTPSPATPVASNCSDSDTDPFSCVDIGRTYGGYAWYDPCSGSYETVGSPTTLVGSDPEQQAFNFFVSKGLTAAQSAGIVGNLIQESGVNPNAVEPNGVGHGIAQWSAGGRWDTTTNDNLKWFAAQQNNAPINSLLTQLDFMWYELSSAAASPWNLALDGTPSQISAQWGNSAGSEYPSLKTITGNDKTAADQAANSFGFLYEQFGIQGSRDQYAEEVFGRYGGGASNSGTSESSTGCGGYNGESVDCTNPTTAGSGLSETRQKVVCQAEAQLALWKSQPGYPGYTASNPGPIAYAAKGFLPYSQNNYQEWCADFVSWIYNQVGYPLQPDPNWRVSYVPNIPGLAGPNFTWHPIGDGYKPVPGDIATHFDFGHTNIFISSGGGVDTFIGGDQGNGPYGTEDPPSGSIVSIEQGTTAELEVDGYLSPTN
jgi:hypothetical protein